MGNSDTTRTANSYQEFHNEPSLRSLGNGLYVIKTTPTCYRDPRGMFLRRSDDKSGRRTTNLYCLIAGGMGVRIERTLTTQHDCEIAQQALHNRQAVSQNDAWGGNNICPSKITWEEGMPTVIDIGTKRFVVPYSGGNYINLTDRSLRRAFDNSLDPVRRRATLLDTRVLDLWAEAFVWSVNPIPSVPDPNGASERVRNRHLDRLERSYRNRNIIR